MATKFLNLSTDTTLGGVSPSDELAVSQKAIKTYVDNHGGGGSVAIDNITITKNADDEIQAVAVIDQNTGIAKTWTGTMAEYDAIVTKDPDTEYIITDDIGGSATEIGQITEALNDKVDKGHQVIEFQKPTAGNNYTWYRKYADGWVEQGGVFLQTINTGDTAWSATLPIAMANYYYVVNVQTDGGYAGNTTIQCENNSTTQIKGYARAPSGGGTKRIMWSVSGMAA